MVKALGERHFGGVVDNDRSPLRERLGGAGKQPFLPARSIMALDRKDKILTAFLVGISLEGQEVLEVRRPFGPVEP